MLNCWWHQTHTWLSFLAQVARSSSGSVAKVTETERGAPPGTEHQTARPLVGQKAGRKGGSGGKDQVRAYQITAQINREAEEC